MRGGKLKGILLFFTGGTANYKGDLGGNSKYNDSYFCVNFVVQYKFWNGFKNRGPLPRF